jgi:hypothetical protein
MPFSYVCKKISNFQCMGGEVWGIYTGTNFLENNLEIIKSLENYIPIDGTI